MKDKNVDFYTGLQSLLQYHEKIGLGPIPINDGIRSFLDTRPQIPSHIADAKIISEPPVKKVDLEKVQIVEEVEYSLGDIQKEVEGCTECDLNKERVYPVVGRGEKPVRLMIVGDWLALSGNPPIEKLLFGQQQDQMLFRMLTAISLSPEDVFITNVIKCGLAENRQPHAVHVKRCMTHLKRQINVLRPEFICTMGMIAAKAVLERSLPLSRLRGRFHEYKIDQSGASKVLTTYHPSYLLQNPEMKKATWDDLQLLARKMGLVTKA